MVVLEDNVGGGGDERLGGGGHWEPKVCCRAVRSESSEVATYLVLPKIVLKPGTANKSRMILNRVNTPPEVVLHMRSTLLL